jgi:hypothetical protein
MSIVEPSGLVICTVNGKAITLGAIAPTLKVEGRWSLVDEAVPSAGVKIVQESRGDGLRAGPFDALRPRGESAALPTAPSPPKTPY